MLDPSGVGELLDDQNSRKRKLVDAAAAGKVLECSQLSIEQLSVSDNAEHIIDSEWLRDLLLKRCDKPPDQRGIRLHGARITGTLDLTHVEAAVGMELRGCSFDHPVQLGDARLPWLLLNGTCVPALYGDGLHVDGGLLLGDGFRATGRGEDGAVRLLRAHIAGQLSLRGAQLINETGPALVGDGLHVDGDLFLDDGFRAIGGSEDGAVRLLRAHVTGELSLRGAHLINETGPALAGGRLEVNGDLFLNDGSGRTGTVRTVRCNCWGLTSSASWPCRLRS